MSFPPISTDPNQSLNSDVPGFDSVKLVPWGTQSPGGYKRSAGLFDCQGKFLEEGLCWRYHNEPLTVAPDNTGSVQLEKLEGRWLFGGMLYRHFGHFLCESTARLWATQLRSDYTGIIFFSKPAVTWEQRLLRSCRSFFDHLGLENLMTRAPQKPLVIEHLDCPEQGFGIGKLAGGRPEYRSFMRQRLCDRTSPSGSPRLYISRSKLMSKRGTVLMEDQLEKCLEDEGYEIFHPQMHSIETQIARYRASRCIIALDGSALHLAAMVVEPECKVAILNRGPSANIEDYSLQFHHFSGIDALCINALSAFYSPRGQRVVKREVYSALDLRKISTVLAEEGFIEDTKGWKNVDSGMELSAVNQLEAKLQVVLERHNVD